LVDTEVLDECDVSILLIFMRQNRLGIQKANILNLFTYAALVSLDVKALYRVRQKMYKHFNERKLCCSIHDGTDNI
jgi:hypothetical protein